MQRGRAFQFEPAGEVGWCMTSEAPNNIHGDQTLPGREAPAKSPYWRIESRGTVVSAAGKISAMRRWAFEMCSLIGRCFPASPILCWIKENVPGRMALAQLVR